MSQKVSLIFLGLAFCVPFLLPWHQPPIHDFYPEITAAFLLGLAFLSQVFYPVFNIRLPLVAVFPAGFSLVLLIQLLAGVYFYQQAHLIGLLYFLMAIAVLLVVATLKEKVGAAAVIEVLAWGLIAGGVASVVIGISALAGYRNAYIAPFEFSFFGNMAQPNHFSHYLWLSMVSVLYLAARQKLNGKWAVLWGGLILVGLAFSGSRANVLYAVVLLLAAWMMNDKPMLRRVLIVLAVYFPLSWFVPEFTDGRSTLQRLLAGTSFSDVRLTLLQISWEMFQQSPLLGQGLGAFRWFSFMSADRGHGWQGSAEHAHNIFANHAAELGAGALLLLLGLVVYGLHQLWQQRKTAEGNWLLVVVGVGFCHSLVEYPLWYAHFLIIMASALALADSRSKTLRLSRVVYIVLAVAGFGAVANLFFDYRKLEATLENRQDLLLVEQMDALIDLRQSTLLTPQVDLTLISIMPPTRMGMDSKIELCEQALPYSPVKLGVLNCALVYALAGKEAEANRLWKLGSMNLSQKELQAYKLGVQKLMSATEKEQLHVYLNAQKQK